MTNVVDITSRGRLVRKCVEAVRDIVTEDDGLGNIESFNVTTSTALTLLVVTMEFVTETGGVQDLNLFLNSILGDLNGIAERLRQEARSADTDG